MNNNENGKKDSLKALINDSIKELNEMAEVSDANGQFRKIIMDQLSRVMTMEETQITPRILRRLNRSRSASARVTVSARAFPSRRSGFSSTF